MSAPLLVPLDGSPLADRILGQVRRLLRRRDAQVHLLRVLPKDFADDGSVLPEQQTEDVWRHLERLRDGLVREGATVRLDVRPGEPAATILHVADEVQPWVIACSTHGRSGPARYLLGSVAERVLREARHPLLLANRQVAGGAAPAEAEPRIGRILVPLDGSPVAAEVLPLAIEWAKLYEAEIVLAHIGPDFGVPPPMAEVLIPPPMPLADLLKVVESSRIAVAAAGVPVRVVAAFDRAASGILRMVADERADLVACCTHGRTGAARWAFGSVAEKVVRHAPVPVLVWRSSARVTRAPARPPTAPGKATAGR